MDKQLKRMSEEGDKLRVKMWNISPKEFKDILSTLKSIPGAIIDMESSSRDWLIPHTNKSIELLKFYGFPDLKKSIRSIPGRPWRRIPLSSQLNFLWPFQREGVQFIEWTHGRCLVGDDMGLGKSAQAIAFLRNNPEKIPVLVVVKASTKLQWEQEIHRFHPGFDVTVLNGKTPYPIDGDKIYVINWDILSDWVLELSQHSWKIIVGDEVQVLAKGHKVKRVKAFAKLAKKSPHIIGLSGTPIKSYLWQFFTILNIIDKKAFPDRTSFYIRYCGMSPVDSEPPLNRLNNIDELRALLKRVMIRRTKRQVLKDLPEKVRTVIPLYIADIKKYREAEKALLPDIHGDKATTKTFDHLKWSAFEVKKEAVVKWIQDFLSSTDEKICVFGYHREVLEYLQDKFKQQSVLYYGGVSQTKKHKMIQQFQEDKSCRVFFGNILSAGVGVDGLQKVCSTGIVIEFSWNPTDHDQVEGRLERIGQKNQIMVYYLVAPQTVESHIMALLDEKRRIIKTVLDGEAPGENELLKGLIRRYQENGK